MRPPPAPSVAAPSIPTSAERAALFGPPGDARSPRATSPWRAGGGFATASALRGGSPSRATSAARCAKAERLPPAAVDVVADQLGADPEAFDLHAAREGTRRELAELLGLRTVGRSDHRAAAATERDTPVVSGVVDALKGSRILVPRPALVERLGLRLGGSTPRPARRCRPSSPNGSRGRAAPCSAGSGRPPRASRRGAWPARWSGSVACAPSRSPTSAAMRSTRTAAGRSRARPRSRTPASGSRPREECCMAVLVVFVIERRAALTDLGAEMWSRMTAPPRRARPAGRPGPRRWRGTPRDHLLPCRALEAARREGRDRAGAGASCRARWQPPRSPPLWAPPR